MNLACGDLLLAVVNLSQASSQLLSNLDEDHQKEGSTWQKPTCGKRTVVLAVSSVFQFAGVIYGISFIILCMFFSETVLQIVVLGDWDCIDNKIDIKTNAHSPPKPATLDPGRCRCLVHPRLGPGV